MNAPSVILKFSEITKSYGTVDAVRDIDLEVGTGEFLTLLGPSGSGKSTLLHLLAGFVTPTSGEIYLEGKPISGTPPHKRGLGVVFQNYALFPHLSVFENIAFPLRNLRWSSQDIEARVDEMLRLVHLDRMADRSPSQLSGGQQQRVALARSLAFEPSVLLLDEPLSALDRKLRDEMLREFRRLHEILGTTMIFVTHDQEEALGMSDRIAVLNKGKLVRLGTPREIYEDPQDHFSAQFLGETNFFRCASTTGEGVLLNDHAVPVCFTHGLPPGSELTISVRPEKICLGEPASGCASVNGVIEDVLYLGALTNYKLILDGGQELMVKQFNRFHSSDYSAGRKVTAWWHPEDAKLVTV